ADEKSFDFKPGFMTSFLDFLKTGKKQSGLEPGHDGHEQESLDLCSSLKGGIRPLSSLPPALLPTPPQKAAGTFSGGGQCDGADLALSSCKPLDEDLKRNLETLPSFSSDEEDSVSKNQDLQKSISSAISALYDTPHSLAAAMACAMAKALPTLSPPTPQESPLSPTLPAMPPLIPSMENGKEEVLMYTQDHIQDKEEENLVSPQTNTERAEGREEKEGREKEQQGGSEETRRDPQGLLQGALAEQQEKEEEERRSEVQTPEVLEVEGPPSDLSPAPPSPSPPLSASPPSNCSPPPLPPLSLSVPPQLLVLQEDPLSEQLEFSFQPAPPAGSTSPPTIFSSPLSNLPLSQSIPPPSTTPPPSSSDQDQEPEAEQPSPFSLTSSSPSSPSSSSSSPPPSPPTPEEPPASQRLTSLHLAKKQADAAIAGESEEEDSESGGEGIFRERDEFVVRTEDIGTLKVFTLCLC
ncbi:proline-rich protein 12-like, partial [Notothenia coriiceps]|uniref:Proline-rich protein 12-like n=1 Tax=Notothenia coriiceps TaxID=8208 RepID=A0A6I9MJZ2_9TELE